MKETLRKIISNTAILLKTWIKNRLLPFLDSKTTLVIPNKILVGFLTLMFMVGMYVFFIHTPDLEIIGQWSNISHPKNTKQINETISITNNKFSIIRKGDNAGFMEMAIKKYNPKKKTFIGTVTNSSGSLTIPFKPDYFFKYDMVNDRLAFGIGLKGYPVKLEYGWYVKTVN